MAPTDSFVSTPQILLARLERRLSDIAYEIYQSSAVPAYIDNVCQPTATELERTEDLGLGIFHEQYDASVEVRVYWDQSIHVYNVNVTTFLPDGVAGESIHLHDFIINAYVRGELDMEEESAFIEAMKDRYDRLFMDLEKIGDEKHQDSFANYRAIKYADRIREAEEKLRREEEERQRAKREAEEAQRREEEADWIDKQVRMEADPLVGIF